MCKTDKKDDIINAAMLLLATQGFHGAPMSLIAEKAGVGAGTIYRYFENRDVLIRDVYKALDDRFTVFLMEDYPEGRPVRECYFHIGKRMIAYLVERPIEFMYTSQFHHSPYGLEVRKKKLTKGSGEYTFGHDIYNDGQEQQVIKPMPLALFFNLAFSPIFWAIRDHHSGFITIDDPMTEMIVSSCWDSIKL
jgi:hypothetical protein